MELEADYDLQSKVIPNRKESIIVLNKQNYSNHHFKNVQDSLKM